MTESRPLPRRRRRADAERSIAAILDAAIEVLSERPAASVEEIAGAAGVARQTVYAHYPSREALLQAVVDRALAETVAAIDAAEPDEGPPVEALERLVSASWRTLERYPVLMDLRAPLTPEEEHALHGPILERLERLIGRGQRAGDFDRRLAPAWLLAAFLGLAHAAAQEVAAGRLSAEEASDALRTSVARVFGTAT
ncbi:MAG: TetR/AcrR family transcriptional regulator [Gaiellaceae bacterium]